jgi:hypothetical protein
MPVKHRTDEDRSFTEQWCEGQSWPWSYGSWIYNYLCNPCLSPLMLWVRISIRTRCTTLCGKVCQWLGTGRWFSPGVPASFTNKTDRHEYFPFGSHRASVLHTRLRHNCSSLKCDLFRCNLVDSCYCNWENNEHYNQDEVYNIMW